MKNKSSYENLQNNIRKLKTPKVEVWENQYSDKNYLITVEEPEFTCICPKTGLPDFAFVQIHYRPTKWCIELKSFKYYMYFYRDIGIFHEHVINKILEDLVISCKPRWMQITGKFNPRGGISTTVQAEYGK
jgi:7-cyano-7-deazaguanine reductase